MTVRKELLLLSICILAASVPGATLVGDGAMTLGELNSFSNSSSVPEPGSLGLMILGVSFVATLHKQKAKEHPLIRGK